MRELKVLAASDHNMNGIRMGLQVPGVKSENGDSLYDSFPIEDDEEIAIPEQFKHPFQMALVTPPPSGQQEPVITYDHTPLSGVTGIAINEGRIQICSDSQERTYVSLSGTNPLPISGLNSNKSYYAVLALRYDKTGAPDQFNNTKFTANVYYVDGDIETNKVPAVPGFQTILIGSVAREEISGAIYYTLGKQQLVSDLFYDFRPLLRPFSITADSTAFENGKIKNSYALNDFHFYVREGSAIIGEEKIKIAEADFNCTQNTLVYCTINEDNLSGYINPSTSELQFHDTQNKNWNYLVGTIVFNASQNGLVINQYLCQEIGSGSDTYKVKCISGDAQADFLSAKFIWEDPVSAHPFTNYIKSFIGGQPISSQVSQPGLSGTQWQITPVWMYMNIDDYEDSKEQYLTNDKGNLKWTGAGLQVSGSIADWTEIESLSGGKYLRWKPEYHPSLGDPFYFMASVSGSNQKCVLSGVSFGYTPQPTEKEGVITWSKEKGRPELSIPPPSSNVSTYWTLVGEKLSGLQWAPYDPGGSISLSGSIKNIFELEPTITGNVLRVKTEYDQSIDQFHFVTLENDGSLSAYTIAGDPLTDGPEALMYWSFVDEAPNILYLPDEIEDDDSVLCGDKENGLYWKPLYGSISGEIYKVKVDDQDPSGGFLVDKLTSMLSSLTFSVESDAGGDYVNIDINPDYFYSDDGSIAIEPDEAGTGINFYLSAYLVQVDEGDEPDYLIDKFTSNNGSITGYIDSDGEYDQISLEIDPNYFYSEDGSIAIEETEEGLNFYLSSYMVQTAEGDIPGFLSEKIDSASGSLTITYPEDSGDSKVNIEINNEYFFSSDGSISIEEDAEGGLDFTISSYFVQVGEGDEPDYLFDKFTSETGSISGHIVNDGEYGQVSLDIDPNYFTSSDESIYIEQTGDGLDFTISSWLSMVNEGDQPGYLNEKFDSTSGSIIIDDEDAYLNFEINPSFFFSSDGTVMIESDSNGIDFTIDEEGLSSTVKEIISSQVSEMISSYVTEHFTELISSYFPSGAGLLYINNGQLSVIPIGDGVAVGANGTLTFEETEPCD